MNGYMTFVALLVNVHKKVSIAAEAMARYTRRRGGAGWPKESVEDRDGSGAARDSPCGGASDGLCDAVSVCEEVTEARF